MKKPRPDVLFICNQKAHCSGSSRCGKECSHSLNPENAVNFTQLNYNGAFIEIPRPQQLTGSWEPIEGTDEVMCSQCFIRLKNKTSQGQTFKICPMCGVYIDNEHISIKNNKKQ